MTPLHHFPLLGFSICASAGTLAAFGGWLWLVARRKSGLAKEVAKKDFPSFTEKRAFALTNFVTPTPAQAQAYELWQKAHAPQVAEAATLVPTAPEAELIPEPLPESALPTAALEAEATDPFALEMARQKEALFQQALGLLDTFRDVTANPITEPGNASYEQGRQEVRKLAKRAQRALIAETSGPLVDLRPTGQTGVSRPVLVTRSAMGIPRFDFDDEEPESPLPNKQLAPVGADEDKDVPDLSDLG